MSAKRETRPYIPEEIIVSILRKLDVRDVARCRCVCRRWKDLTTKEDFVHSLEHRSAPMIFVEFYIGTFGIDSHYLLDKWWEASPRKIKCRTLFYHKTTNNYELYAEGSQNGFIFFNFERFYSIVNPITREEVRIIFPDLRFHISAIILGIFLHPVSREYCTLWRVNKEYKVLNLENEPCWRGIENLSYEAGVLSECAVFVEDCFYWMVQPCQANVESSQLLKAIMSFDIKTEELSLIPLPDDCTGSGLSLHNFDGFLSIGKTKWIGLKMIVKIWTLTDRERKLWTSSNYDFNLGKQLKGYSFTVQMINEQVLLGLIGTKGEMLVCSLKQGTIRKISCKPQQHGKRWLSSVLFYTPSLASLKKCRSLIHFEIKEKPGAKYRAVLISESRWQRCNYGPGRIKKWFMKDR